MYWNIY